MKNEDKYKWDLSLIIKDENDFNEKLEKAYKLIDRLTSFKGKILDSSESLYEFLTLDDKKDKLIEELYLYSHLGLYGDGNDKYFKEKVLISEKLDNDSSEKLSFISSELLSSDFNKIEKYAKENKKLEKYLFSFEKMFRHKKYILSEKEEEVISYATSAFGTPSSVYSALNNVDKKFDKIKDENGKSIELTESNYISLISNSGRCLRKRTFNKYYNFFENHINTISNLYLGKIKENFFISNIRGYKSPLFMSLYSDNISEELFNNLINVTNKNIKYLNEYFMIKTKILGVKKMHMYDVYASLTKNKRKVTYEDGLDIIYKALNVLGDEYLNDFKKIIEGNLVDVFPRKGKRGGAFQWSTYTVPTYVSLNFENDINSVSTLAHEMGHALHSYYSKRQDYTYSDYPIILAEIASTVNEILLSDYLIKKAKTKDEKIKYLSEILEKTRATIYRQVMFSEFERDCFDKHQQGVPLTKDELCTSYFNLNKKYFKEVINDENIKYEWARIPHFFTPFYVYKYATGFTCALIIASKLLSNENGFKEKYINFLSSGCSKYPLDTIKELGIDLEDEKTLQIGFDYFKEKIDDLKKLIEKE